MLLVHQLPLLLHAMWPTDARAGACGPLPLSDNAKEFVLFLSDGAGALLPPDLRRFEGRVVDLDCELLRDLRRVRRSFSAVLVAAVSVSPRIT